MTDKHTPRSHGFRLPKCTRLASNTSWEYVHPSLVLKKVDEGFQQQQRDLETTVSEFLRSRIRERVARHAQTTKCDDRYSYRRLGGTTISRAGPGNFAGGGGHRQGGGGGDATTTVGYSFAGGAGAGAGASASGAAASSTIETLLRSQTRPTAPLVAVDWQAVLRHVYKGAAASAEAKTVAFLIKEAISTKREGGRGQPDDCESSGRSRKGAAGSPGAGQGQSSVPYGVFLQVLLGYHLHGYLRRLEAFREDFKKASYCPPHPHAQRLKYQLQS